MDDIESYLISKGFDPKDKGDKYVMACPIPGCSDKKNLHFVIYKSSGVWSCLHCGEKGKFNRLKYLLGDKFQVSTMGDVAGKTFVKADSTVHLSAQENLADNPTIAESIEKARGLTYASLVEFKVGLGSDNKTLVFPFYEKGELVNVKHIKKNPDGSKECWFVVGAKIPLWNVDSIGKNTKVAVTEGELDAISLRQMGWIDAVVSVPKGAKDWQPSYTSALSGCSDIWLFYDNDPAGKDGANRAIAALGEERCKRVLTPFKDLNECLINGLTLQDVTAPDIVLTSSSNPVNKMDKYIKELRVNLLNDDYKKGLGSPFVDLNNYSKFRYGELNVILGNNGSGKTTFSTFLAYSWIAEDKPVAIASFEMRPFEIVKKVLQMETGKNYQRDITSEDVDQTTDALVNAPLYFIDIFGRASVDSISKSIRYCRHEYGIRIFILDSLQFIACTSETKSVDDAMKDLNCLANELNISIVLIVHPNRAYTDGNTLRIEDGKGGSAIEQISHVVWILFRNKKNEKLTVTPEKNRIDGKIGKSFELYYDENNDRYTCDGMYETPRLDKLNLRVYNKPKATDPLHVHKNTKKEDAE